MEEPLKPEFIASLMDVFEPRSAKSLIEALDTEPTTAIRLNKCKLTSLPAEIASDSRQVAWSNGTGYLLAERPQFALLPHWHAGAFYVQEPASMIMAAVATELKKQILVKNIRWLDLCAAPGGKTTAAIASLPDDAFVVANEYDPHRTSILVENVSKWGASNVAITRGDTAWVRKMPESFHVVAVDAPCSGEGMMRKDAQARTQWSQRLVEQCATLQREILGNAWEALMPGGYLIYSTCTFNRHENEDNVAWLLQKYDAELIELPQSIAPDAAHTTIAGINALRFMPHITIGEGLFMAVLRKRGELSETKRPKAIRKERKGRKAALPEQLAAWIKNADAYEISQNASGDIMAIPEPFAEFAAELRRNAPATLLTGIKIACTKGRDIIPATELALSRIINKEAFPKIRLTISQALDYLHRGNSGAMEAINASTDNIPKGCVLVEYEDIPLGFVKNIGNRVNNLYPTNWRLRNL